MPVNSCANIRQLSQYIYLKGIQCNQQCDQKLRSTYISHYWHIVLNKYACDFALICPPAFYRPRITAQTSPKKQKFVTDTPHIIDKHVPNTNMLLKCCIYATYAN